MRKVVATIAVVCGLGLVMVPFALLFTGTVALAMRARPEPTWNTAPGLPAGARPS